MIKQIKYIITSVCMTYNRLYVMHKWGYAVLVFYGIWEVPPPLHITKKWTFNKTYLFTTFYIISDSTCIRQLGPGYVTEFNCIIFLTRVI